MVARAWRQTSSSKGSLDADFQNSVIQCNEFRMKLLVNCIPTYSPTYSPINPATKLRRIVAVLGSRRGQTTILLFHSKCTPMYISDQCLGSGHSRQGYWYDGSIE